jgi:porin
LEDEGITFSLNYIQDFQTDVSGSQTHHATEFGRFRFSLDIDFKKLSDFDGEFFTTFVYQYGRNLSGEFLNVNTLTSPIAGEEFLGIDEAWYQQGFWDSRVKIKVGQIAAVNEFGATDFGDILFNDELSYAPNALFNSSQPFSPPGKPGAIIKFDLRDITPGLYFKFGGFTAVQNATRPDSNGFDYTNDFSHGAAISGEVGYVEQKGNYAGTYKIGFNGTDASHYNDLTTFSGGNFTGPQLTGDYTVYTLIEKSVYHPRDADGKLDKTKGLDLMGEAVYSPGDRNLLQYEGTFGARYTGPFSSRPKDKVGLGFIYSQAGDHASQAFANAEGGHLNGESTVELDYQYHVTDWLQVQPVFQEIFSPRGDSNRSDITVLALQTVVNF